MSNMSSAFRIVCQKCIRRDLTPCEINIASQIHDTCHVMYIMLLRLKYQYQEYECYWYGL